MLPASMSYPCFVAHCRLVVTESMTVTLYMGFSISVSSLVPVLIRFGSVYMQRKLDIHIPVYMINIRIPFAHY